MVKLHEIEQLQPKLRELSILLAPSRAEWNQASIREAFRRAGCHGCDFRSFVQEDGHPRAGGDRAVEKACQAIGEILR